MSERMSEPTITDLKPVFAEFDLPPHGSVLPLLRALVTTRQRAEAAEAELDRERMRLAACGVAALGYFNGCEDVYRSASLEDVLKLRAERDALRKDAEAAKIDHIDALDAYRQMYESERDARRTVDDAMVERAWKAIADVCGVISHDDDGRLLPTPHINIVEASDVRAALNAALAVQPTTEASK